MYNTFKYWWVLIIKGLIQIILGVYFVWFANESVMISYDTNEALKVAEAWAAVTIPAGIALSILGVIYIVAAFLYKDDNDDWQMALGEGLVDLFVGLLLLTFPISSGIGIVIAIVFWLLFSTIFKIIGALRYRKQFSSWWVNILVGVIVIFLCYTIATSDMYDGYRLAFTLLGTALLAKGVMSLFVGVMSKGHTTEEVLEMRESAEDFKEEVGGTPSE